MAAKKFSRTTKGLNTEVFVDKNIAETAQTTYDLFVANAAVGEIGIFNDSTRAKITAAIGAGVKFFIAQKQSGGTKKTQPMSINTVTSTKSLYVGPVLSKWFLGWNGTGGSLNLAAAPAVNKVYDVTLLETTEGNEPYPTWEYQYVAKA